MPQGEREMHLKEEYIKARDEQRRSSGSVRSHFFANSLSDHDRAVYGWLPLVVLMNELLCNIVNKEKRRWFKIQVEVSIKAVVDAIPSLVQHVEDKMSTQMRESKGALMVGA